jgi:hypothetical protein
VRPAADRRHGDRIMSGHDTLDFGREYLEPRRADHVLLAVIDERLADFVHNDRIASNATRWRSR